MTEAQRNELDEKKEYLNSYRGLVGDCKRIEQAINQLRLSKMCPSAIVSDMPGAHNIKDLSDYAASLDCKVRAYEKVRYEKILRYTEILDCINAMEDETQKSILFKRYIELKPWEEICVDIGYAWSWLHKVHAKALNSFEKR